MSHIHTVLDPQALHLIRKLLKGETLSPKDLPQNGKFPEWQTEIINALHQADDPREKLDGLLWDLTNAPFVRYQIKEAYGTKWSWPEKTKETKFKRRDYIHALESLNYLFMLNICTDRVEVNGEPITDVKEAEIKSDLRNLGMNRVNVARDHYIAHASKRGRYHPVRYYLTSLRWDGKPHIEALASYFKDRHKAFIFILKLFLIGAVAKAMTGERNRMLVLDGEQSLGKSHFVRWLVPECMRERQFVESPINPEIKDHRIRLANTWIWEVAELGSTVRRSDRESLKHFLSMKQVTVRVPYAHHDISKNALSSFVGTINDEAGFLNDPTGHTRFMTVQLEDINWDYAKDIDVHQVWAQAYALYKKGVPWQPEGDKLAVVQAINRGFEIIDPIDEHLVKLFIIKPERKDWFLSTNTILEILKNNGWSLGKPQVSSMALGSALKKMGLESDRRLDKSCGERVRGYVGIQRRFQPNNPDEEIPGWAK
jgi:hypothetical protein